MVQEFAQTKLALARALRPSGRDLATKKTLNRQAAELLRRSDPLDRRSDPQGLVLVRSGENAGLAA